MLNLKDWAIKSTKSGLFQQIIDPNLDMAVVYPPSLTMVMDTARKCVADRGAGRPSMMDVVWDLDEALRLKEAAFPGSPRISQVHIAVSSSLNCLELLQTSRIYRTSLQMICHT